jgi:hypothetical protein
MHVSPPPGNAPVSRQFFKYLTPHKILVLMLVHAYCSSLVPAKYNAVVFKLLLDQVEVIPSLVSWAQL